MFAHSNHSKIITICEVEENMIPCEDWNQSVCLLVYSRCSTLYNRMARPLKLELKNQSVCFFVFGFFRNLTLISHSSESVLHATLSARLQPSENYCSKEMVSFFHIFDKSVTFPKGMFERFKYRLIVEWKRGVRNRIEKYISSYLIM